MGKFKTGLAELLIGTVSLVGLADKANATPIITTSTTVSALGVDRDPVRAGLQKEYSWNITNNYSGGSTVNDSLDTFEIKGDLRGVYDFSNLPNGWTLVGANPASATFENTSQNLANNIYWGATTTFSGLIDESLTLGGDIIVPSQAYSISGASNSSNVSIPTPEPTTLGILGMGALALRRRKRSN